MSTIHKNFVIGQVCQQRCLNNEMRDLLLNRDDRTQKRQVQVILCDVEESNSFLRFCK